MISEKLLIIDDEEDLLDGLSRMLRPELPNVDILTMADERQALYRLSRTPMDLVLLDIRMPEIDGLDLLEAMLKNDPLLTVVMMTGHGTIELAVEAMKKGAYDFITKPFDKPVLVRALRKGLERNRLLRENRQLRRQVAGEKGFGGLVGQSVPMRRLYKAIQAISQSDYSVLIRGESGTGKELTARAIHDQSKRKSRSMVTVNCPAIPEQLLESELFGHKRGAFTGAERDKTGLFAEAHESSLFLDEVGDLPLSIQTKLLRVLQEGEIKPLGSNTTIRIDVRIIAATNRDLEADIKAGRFRSDLYYRLNVVALRTPSLAEIREDIPLLTDRFTRMVCSELDMPSKRFTADALEYLVKKPWPGNIRELQNVVRRAVIFSAENNIRGADLAAADGLINPREPCPDDVVHFGPGMEWELYKTAKEKVVHRFTSEYVRQLLENTAGNVTKAAELSGLGRASLQKIMRRLGLKSEQFKN